MVCRVCLDQLVHLETRDPLEMTAPPESLEMLVLEVLEDKMEMSGSLV